jgi:hypothetical protein
MYLNARDGHSTGYHNSSKSRLSVIAFGIITIVSALFLDSIETSYSQSIDDFVGTWENPNTSWIPKVIVEKHPTTGQPTLHFFGKCHPQYCDWGTQQGAFATDRITGIFDQGFAIRRATLTMNPDQTLRVDVFHDYTDPGRPDLASTDILTRTDFSISTNPSSAAITAGETSKSTITVKLESGNIPSVSLLCSMSPPSSDQVTCQINPDTVSFDQSTADPPSGTAELTISTKPETQPNKYTATITGSAQGGIQRTAALNIDVKASNGDLSPTMLALIIGGAAAAAVGGGVLVMLKNRARTRDESIP